jgi:hypothetical protein
LKEKEGFNAEVTENAEFTERRWRLESRLIKGWVPRWEEYPHTPAVFVRVASKGLAGYGTWKSVRRMGDGAATETQRHRAVDEGGWLVSNTWLTIITSPPPAFVSVAAKGLSPLVSLLFATVAGGSISVADKGLRGITARPLEHRGARVHPPHSMEDHKNKGVAKWGSRKCMKRKGNGRNEVSSKMGSGNEAQSY